MAGWRGEMQGAARDIVAGHADQRIIPHVIDAQLRIAHVERGGQVGGPIDQRGQLRRRRLAFPAAADRGEPAGIEDTVVREGPVFRHARAFGQAPVHDQRAEIPLPLFDAGQIGAPEPLAVAAPAGHGPAAVDRRASGFLRLEGEPVVPRVQLERRCQVIVARQQHDAVRPRAGGARGVPRRLHPRQRLLPRARRAISALRRDKELSPGRYPCQHRTRGARDPYFLHVSSQPLHPYLTTRSAV